MKPATPWLLQIVEATKNVVMDARLPLLRNELNFIADILTSKAYSSLASPGGMGPSYLHWKTIHYFTLLTFPPSSYHCPCTFNMAVWDQLPNKLPAPLLRVSFPGYPKRRQIQQSVKIISQCINPFPICDIYIVSTVWSLWTMLLWTFFWSPQVQCVLTKFWGIHTQLLAVVGCLDGLVS